MAAADPVKDLKERATCPICLELFRDAVMSECGHSFCEECIARLCEGDGDVACPQCRKKFRKGDLRPNWELRNVVESLPPWLRSQTGGELRGGNTCEGHQEPLKLYCKEDQTRICVFCERSQAHRGHTVVLVEEAVQEHWETLTKHLAGMESTYGRLHPLVSRDRKHLSPSAVEEAHEKLKRLAENLATLLKVDTKGQRQRFEALASQTQPREPDWRGRGRGIAMRNELQECKGREPGSEPAAEKQEETRSHVVRICEKAPTPKYGLDQASLDPGIHMISSTTESEEHKVDVKGLVSRFEEWLFPGPSEVCFGEEDRVSPAGQGAAQTELGGHTGRGGRESQELKAAAAGVPRKANPPPLSPKRYNTLPASWNQQQADAPSRSDSLQGQGPVRSRQRSGGSRQDGISPGGRVALPPELQGCAVEVTLDPATAHPWLVLSEDRKSVRRGETPQRLPNNPERFDTCISVLGSEWFTSGRHYWEVEVGARRGWEIGVARDSVQRKGKIQPKPHFGIWALDSLDVSPVPRNVGVYLDYEGGEVRFYNAENMALIFSLTATFTGRLVPFFHLCAVASHISLSPCQR